MKNIQLYRGMAGLTQDELSKAIGINRTYLSLLESDDFENVPKQDIIKLALVFNISPIKLYGMCNFKIKPKNNKEILEAMEILYNELDKEAQKQYVQEIKRKN